MEPIVEKLTCIVASCGNESATFALSVMRPDVTDSVEIATTLVKPVLHSHSLSQMKAAVAETRLWIGLATLISKPNCNLHTSLLSCSELGDDLGCFCVPKDGAKLSFVD